jgi:peroxiredoxin
MKRTLAFALLLLALGAIGYFGVRVYQQAAAEQATQRRVQSLPALRLTTVDGAPLRRNELLGDRPAVLVFFRPSCPYCRQEARSIRAHRALADTAEVLLVSARPAADLRAFADSLRLRARPRIRVARDASGAALRTFGVDRVPTTFVYGEDGTLLRRFEGEVGASALYSVLSRASSRPGS